MDIVVGLISTINGVITIIETLERSTNFSEQLEILRVDIQTTQAIVNHIEKKKPKNPFVDNWMNDVRDAISDCDQLLKRFQDPDSGTNNSTNLNCLFLRRPNDLRKLGKMRKRFNNLCRHQQIILQVCNNEGTSFISRWLISGGILGVVGAALLVVL